MVYFLLAKGHFQPLLLLVKSVTAASRRNACYSANPVCQFYPSEIDSATC